MCSGIFCSGHIRCHSMLNLGRQKYVLRQEQSNWTRADCVLSVFIPGCLGRHTSPAEFWWCIMIHDVSSSSVLVSTPTTWVIFYAKPLRLRGGKWRWVKFCARADQKGGSKLVSTPPISSWKTVGWSWRILSDLITGHHSWLAQDRSYRVVMSSHRMIVKSLKSV